MDTIQKRSIKTGLYCGILYTILMGVDEYWGTKEIVIWKSIFRFLFFAIFMGLVNLYNLRTLKKDEK
ncbi:hypothetical protein [Formosa algae]|uniref:Uncharacterized protein n=1 Tax=Formosa algae TaxID=225843 RepID=A0A9X0YPE8_9FLAO|nr:hypothetical protein [Formosa algae]MBP1841229.1 hypothetical protein [Formosa algae]MDQ0336848.1 hypothetical protein [Formosa algae]PNW28408.1 hypothetical protein BKP44_08445 [Formosa algae]